MSVSDARGQSRPLADAPDQADGTRLDTNVDKQLRLGMIWLASARVEFVKCARCGWRG